MGTFHHGKGDLHGITIVIETPGPMAYIGRCDTLTDEGAILLDADVYEGEESGLTREAWVKKAARVGVWKKFDRVFVPRVEIAQVTRLGDVPT